MLENGKRYCDRCGVELTKENNKCGYELCDKCNDWLNAECKEPTTKNNLASDREDAVERLNAIKQLIGYDKDSEIVKATQKSLDMAIKALEQESVIDKIRAEIKDYFSITCDGNCDNCNRVVKNPCGESVDGAWVLHIIDKYKAESEET